VRSSSGIRTWPRWSGPPTSPHSSSTSHVAIGPKGTPRRPTSCLRPRPARPPTSPVLQWPPPPRDLERRLRAARQDQRLEGPPALRPPPVRGGPRSSSDYATTWPAARGHPRLPRDLGHAKGAAAGEGADRLEPNNPSKTTVAPYSLRLTDDATSDAALVDEVTAAAAGDAASRCASRPTTCSSGWTGSGTSSLPSRLTRGSPQSFPARSPGRSTLSELRRSCASVDSPATSERSLYGTEILRQ